MCGFVFAGYFVHHVLVGDGGEGGGVLSGVFFSTRLILSDVHVNFHSLSSCFYGFHTYKYFPLR